MGGTHVHIFHEKPTFYFGPVDGHLCYGDLETLGDIQELHIKSPVTGKTKEHSSCSTAALQWIQCFVALKNSHSCALAGYQDWIYGPELSIFSYVFLKFSHKTNVYTQHNIGIIIIVVLNLMLWAHISHGMQPLQSKQPWLNSIKASVLPDDTSEGLCGCNRSYFYCYCYSC